MKDRLLWVDDEIDILRPHVMFLEAKGYEVSTVTNGFDAVELCRNEVFDLIFLDENMPGMSGLETLSKIKDIRPEVPVIMITKSEEDCRLPYKTGQPEADTSVYKEKSSQERDNNRVHQFQLPAEFCGNRHED